MSANFYHPAANASSNKEIKQSERKAKRKIMRRLSAVIMAIFMTIISSLQVFASVTPERAIQTASDIEAGAEAMLVANALKKCVSKHMYTGGSSVGTYNDYFEGSGYWSVDIGVGAYLEKLTAGSISHRIGIIHCGESQNLVDLFAKKLGITKAEVLCNNGAPGILAAYSGVTNPERGNPYGSSKNTNCGADPEGQHVKAPDADNYLSNLWSTHKKESWPEWDKVDDYREEANNGDFIYYMYFKEYQTLCGQENTVLGNDTDTNEYPSSYGDYDHLPGIPIVDEHGRVRWRWAFNKSTNAIDSKGGFAKGENGATCSTLVDKMNIFYKAYRDRIKEIYEADCPTAMREDVDKALNDANEVLGNKDASKDDKKKAQKVVDDIAAAEAKGFVEGNEKDGWSCSEIEGVSKVKTDDEDLDNKDDEDGGNDNDVCYADAGALGWILCPVIKSIDGILSNLYNAIEEHFLKIEVNEAFTVDSPTYNAWNIIRNIANVAFVAMMLFVILSQLTGFGIDNYGIKRTLPRIIIAAILVNISFIICQLCIDLSNIIGVNLRSMLENLAPNGAGSSLSGLAFAGGVATLGSMGIGIAFLVANFGSSGWVGIILMLLLAVIAILIAALFLFIILIARQAALIMLVVIAPLGLVCYMLPNTERLFKKWIEAIKGLLMLYPICSVVIGGGVFAGAVLSKVGDSMGSDGWVYRLAAMLIQVVPYFFIPKLLRGSLNAIGGIGDRIGNLGSRLRRTATGAAGRGIRNSERYRGRVARRSEARHDRYLDRQMERNLDPNRRRGLMGRVAERNPDGSVVRNADGTVKINKDALEDLSTSERRQLMQAQARQRDNLTQGARINSGNARLSDTSIAAQAAQYEMADVIQEVKDQEALISSEEGAADGTNVEYLTAQLAKELGKNDNDVNTSRIRALTNMLSRNGDAGRTGVRDAMLTAEQNGGGSVGDKARQAYTQNIMSNWAADYKNNQRSVYDYAKGNTGASAGGTLSAGIADAVNSVKQEQLASMDESELQTYVERLNAAATTSGGAAGTATVSYNDVSADASGNTTSQTKDVQVSGFNFEDANKIRSIARDTLANEQLTKDMKLSQKEQIAKLAGYSSIEEAITEIRKQNNMQTVNIGGSDYQVHRVPDGFSNASVNIQNGQVIYRNSDGSTFNASTNSIDLHSGGGSGGSP